MTLRADLEHDVDVAIDGTYATRAERVATISAACLRLDAWDRTRATVLGVLDAWGARFASEVPVTSTARGYLADDITDNLT